MLEQLTIKNVAVIDRLDASFGSGMSVLTGETGAGKSIIIDSINMILGSRASKELVRRGKDRAEVQAVFSMTDGIRRALEENEIDTDDDCVIISRRITSDGKSSARVNGAPVTLNMLRDIADMLINIHGQHDNQALLTPAKHINFLDAYSHAEEEKEKYKECYNRARNIKRKLRTLEADEQEKLQKTDLLSYQLSEITSAALAGGEDEELTSRRRLLENAELISVNTQKAYANLYDSPDGRSAYDMISEAADAISEIADISPELSKVYEAISSAMYTIEDAAREAMAFGDSTEFDAQELEETNQRLDLINRLKRKYGSTIAEINEFGLKAKRELNEIETSDEMAKQLKSELDAEMKRLKETSAALTAARSTAAKRLEKEIEAALHELNMEKAAFSVNITPQKYLENGADFVEFMIATNPGEELKPLVKIASGGELSRVMLAIKSILAKADDVNTLIFDEIDTGVSGSAAQKIADKLKAISKDKQVICITHLPQIAGAANNHFLIEKDTDGELASATLFELDLEGRVRELARIVGGGKAGEDYAREILKTD